MNNNGQLPPHNNEAEKALLGSIIIDPDAFYDVADIVKVADFYLGKHKNIYKVMTELNQANTATDFITVNQELISNGYDDSEVYLIELFNAVPTSANARNYAKIVHELALRRKAIQAAGKVADLAYDTTEDIMSQLDEAERVILDIRAEDTRKGIMLADEYSLDFLDGFERRIENKRELSGLPTGFIDLDKLLNGLQSPHQYILAGRPGMGKSILALNIADHIARMGNRVLFFSLEMSKQQIMERRISAITGIDSNHIKNPSSLNEDQRHKIRLAVGELSQWPLAIDVTENLTPATLRAKAIRHKAIHGVDLIIIDHFHLMKPDRRLTRTDLEYGEMSWSLAGLGKTVNAPVLTLAQLNRGVEKRQDKRPLKSDLRESGRIEENAFAILFMFRPSYYDDYSESDICEVNVAKHRDGPEGIVNLLFMPTRGKFGNMSFRENQQINL